MSAATVGAGAVAAEAGRRRTFAIISHPDAGKTTLTEKLLLYGGAIQEAGAVKARNNRRKVTSDWMELERTRGISITSTVLRFEHDDVVLNLLDTPGHRDFSEDTLRVLAAADSAVVLIDAAKGIEAQTLALFEVARARGIPLLCFVNKFDRPGQEPLWLLDHLESTLGVQPVPLTWPVGPAGDLRGVVDRRGGAYHRFERTAGGARIAPETVLPVDAAGEAGAAWTAAEEELELLEAVGAELDEDAFLSGAQMPVLFGSAVSNFGVGLLLEALTGLAPAPRPRPDADGAERELEAPFSAVVFKVQANMDPRHRDRLAFLRICSGRFERGMRATNARTGRPFAMAHAHEVFGREREALEEAFPGDVIGVVGALDLRVGDTLHDGPAVEFPPIPTLAPEHFAYVRSTDTAKRKQFDRGLEQLGQEGVVHVLHRHPTGDPTPILAGVGPLQFEVAAHRLTSEFGAKVRIEPAPWSVARRTDEAGADVLAAASYADVLKRVDGELLAVFGHQAHLDRFAAQHPSVRLDRLLQR
jgi:peptide chain release factor 3